MTPLVVKTCEEFDIFEAKKRFPDSGKACCVLKRKVVKMRFLQQKNDPFWGKNVCYFLEFSDPRTFLLQKRLFLDKNRIFATFRFNTQYFIPESGKRFLSLCITTKT